MLTCLLGADPPLGTNEASLESRAESKQERKKRKTLEQVEGYSGILIYMGTSRETRGLEWGFANRIVRE